MEKQSNFQDDVYSGVEAQNDPDFYEDSLVQWELDERHEYYSIYL